MSYRSCQVRRDKFIEEVELAHASLLYYYPDRVSKSHPEFDIRYTIHQMHTISEELMKTRGEEIEMALHLWLQEEYRMGRLFEQNRWRGFFEPVDYYDIEVYYNRLFVYDEYYFEVILQRETWNPAENGHHPVCFDLNLYGQINSERNTILEYDNEMIDTDHMMPDKRWARGRDRAWFEADDARAEAIEEKIRRRPRWQTHKKRRVRQEIDFDNGDQI